MSEEVLMARSAEMTLLPFVVPIEGKPSRLRLARRVAYGIASAWEWLFGVVALLLGLALLAATPLLQFLSLGYLLEAGGRGARTGPLPARLIAARPPPPPLTPPPPALPTPCPPPP